MDSTQSLPQSQLSTQPVLGLESIQASAPSQQVANDPAWLPLATNDPQVSALSTTAAALVSQTAALVNDGVAIDLQKSRVRRMLTSIIPRFPSLFAQKGIDSPELVANYSELVASMQAIRDTVDALPIVTVSPKTKMGGLDVPSNDPQFKKAA
jgi:hypothetical protein